MRIKPRQLIVIGTIILSLLGGYIALVQTHEQRYNFMEKKLDQFEERLYREAKERI